MKSKRSIQTFLTLILISGFCSCEKFLDTTPKDFIAPEDYYQNEEHLTFALAAVYDVLGNSSMYGNYIPGRLGMDADEMFYARSTALEGPNVFNYSAADATILGLWQALYIGINRANVLLENIDRTEEVSDSVRNVIRGETLFLRGYYHFILVNNWGGVPIVLSATKSATGNEVPRSSAMEVYQQVLEDMQAAIPLVPTATQRGSGGRISKSAVYGMLARVCLHMAGEPLNDVSRYQEALDYAKWVMDSGEHALNPDYTQIFINYAQDLYDVQESIWEVEFWGNSAGAEREIGRIGNNNGIYTTNEEIGFAYGFVNTTARLYGLYEEEDLRRDWAIAPFRYSDTEKVPWEPGEIYQRNCGKWRREYEVVTPKSKNDTPQNFPLLRFSDVLLMFAEAENELNGPTAAAYEAINEVRRRAFGLYLPEPPDPAADPDLSGLDQEGFREAIRDERSRELCFEALRKNDLIRWGMFVPAMRTLGNQMADEAPANLRYGALAGNSVSDRHLLYPIPVYELSLNRELTQNPGW